MSAPEVDGPHFPCRTPTSPLLAPNPPGSSTPVSQIQYRSGVDRSWYSRSIVAWIVLSGTGGTRSRSGAIGSPARSTNRNVRIVAAIRTGIIASNRRRV